MFLYSKNIIHNGKDIIESFLSKLAMCISIKKHVTKNKFFSPSRNIEYLLSIPHIQYYYQFQRYSELMRCFLINGKLWHLGTVAWGINVYGPTSIIQSRISIRISSERAIFDDHTHTYAHQVRTSSRSLSASRINKGISSASKLLQHREIASFIFESQTIENFYWLDYMILGL